MSGHEGVACRWFVCCVCCVCCAGAVLDCAALAVCLGREAFPWLTNVADKVVASRHMLRQHRLVLGAWGCRGRPHQVQRCQPPSTVTLPAMSLNTSLPESVLYTMLIFFCSCLCFSRRASYCVRICIRPGWTCALCVAPVLQHRTLHCVYVLTLFECEVIESWFVLIFSTCNGRVGWIFLSRCYALVLLCWKATTRVSVVQECMWGSRCASCMQ